MLKTKSKILLLLFLILTLVSSYCFATDELATLTVDSADTADHNHTDVEDLMASWTNSDLYICEDTVNISNVVDGNAFVVAKEVTVSGEIGGDLFVVAEKLNIQGGYIYSSIFAVAKEININGVVYDLYAVCDNFNLQSNGFIYRDMKLCCSNANLEGKVRRNAVISANNINLNDEVGTIIYGNLDYSSNSEISIPEGSVVGDVEFKQNADFTSNSKNTIGDVILSNVLDLIGTLLLTFVVVILLLWLAPEFVKRLSNMGVGKSFVCLGIGAATPIVLIFVSILLLVISVGSSIFVSALFGFMLISSIAKAVASLYFGKLFTKLLKLEGNIKLVLITLACSLIIWLINLIPVLGGLLTALIYLFGLGSIVVNIICKKAKNDEVKE